MLQKALFGDHRVLNYATGVTAGIEGDSLILRQEEGSVLVTEQGAVAVSMRAQSLNQDFVLSVIIDEDIREKLQRSFHFCASVLETIDPLHRLSDVVPVAALFGIDYLGWRTRAEQAAKPRTMSIGHREDEIIQFLSPSRLNRSAITQDLARITEDLMVRLRRVVTAKS